MDNTNEGASNLKEGKGTVTSAIPVEVVEASAELPERPKQTKEQKQALILDMHLKGYNSTVIGKAVEMNPSSVRNVIQRLKPIIEIVHSGTELKDIKADLLSGGQFRLLKSALSESKLKKMSTLAGIKGAAELQKMERLERNLSTENVNHHHFGSVKLD